MLAGDWVDTGLPCSMESAAASGWLAAEAVLAARGVVRALAVPHEEMVGLAGLISRGAELMPHRVANRWLKRAVS